MQELASIIGKVVATCQASKYVWLYTKRVEREKTLLLKANNYNSNSIVSFSEPVLDKLKWW